MPTTTKGRRWRTVGARFAFSTELEARLRVDARRDAHSDGAIHAQEAATLASHAGVGDASSGTAAAFATFRYVEEAASNFACAGATTFVADDWARSRARADASAHAARVALGERDVSKRAEGSFFEVEIDRVTQIVSTNASAARSTCGAGRRAWDFVVVGPGAPPKMSAASLRRSCRPSIADTPERCGSSSIVVIAEIHVAEHAIGLGRVFEDRLGVMVAGVCRDDIGAMSR